MNKLCAPFFFAAVLSIAGCASAEREKAKKVEAPPIPNALVAQPQQDSTVPPQTQPPPKLQEVQDAVKRVFKEAALIDTSRQANFAVGDFNGDQSQDLAVVLKPAADKLSDLNEDLPPWILRDPFSTPRPGMLPLRITANETLLAVIHGYGPGGWRDPQATQTYLLKNAVSAGVEMHSKAAVMTANRGKKVPQLRGDLIAEVLKGTSGYLYYDDAGYSWYDPKTFKEEPVKRVVHSGMAARK
ncbi:MAG TPA: hypothetical protein VK475_06835 [Pyrinomonadaceae bacterium]|nr:hypothetical protein [Pyrinomonadaceae bacterium]